MKLSERIYNLSESATIAMAQKSRDLKNRGYDVINLSLGEPDFNTPDFIKEAAKKAIDENYTFYMPVPGYMDLRESISDKFKRDNNLEYSPEQIVVSTGAKQSIANVVLSLVDKGDEVLLPAPFWVTYHEIVKMAEGIPVIVPTDISTDFKVTPEILDKYITPQTKLMIFSSPCNPSGSVYTHEEMHALAEFFSSTYPNVFIISDEIYELINFEGKHESLAQFPEIYPQTITVNGVSKGFAMTGWRVGYIGAPLEIAKACTKIQGQFTSGTCGIAQRAAKAAVEADPVLVSYMKQAFEKRRDLVLEHLTKIEGLKVNKPKGAFYVFPEVKAFFGKSFNGKTIQSASDLTMFLLEEALVACVTGEAFGSPDNIRISYAASESDLEEAMRRIANALNKLS
ncbi:MAG: pyridoxal phosphate-dependent aminotransferase [Bacteroidetes bacterium]|nr:MAG: pyridoxal phosphate-dependent aminotransferase [Bacteroidota bacterium]